MYTLTTPVEDVRGVGPAVRQYLWALDIATVKDLLYHIPFRYEQYANRYTIATAPPDELVSITATVRSITKFTSKRGLKIISATLEDESGKIQAMWFNQDYILLTLKKGDTRQFDGKITTYKGKRTFSNPKIFPVTEEKGDGKIVPIYPVSEGITPRKLYAIIRHVLENTGMIPDCFTEAFRKKHHLPSLDTAIRTLHTPPEGTSLDTYKHRLAFDEVYAFLSEAAKRKHAQEKTPGFPLSIKPADVHAFEHALPYTLTGSQLKTLLDLSLDLSKPYPANRLIQGEVGSGKTTLAAFVLFAAALNGYDGVFVAPTQIVAQQHYDTFKPIFTGLKIPVKKVVGKSAVNGIHAGTAYIGTHALFNHKKTLHPAVVVVDEEHRFGVSQRETFLQNRKRPHLITMTATPIPRTVALTVLADRDVSYLEEIPEKRKHVITKVVQETKRNAAYAWIDKEIEQHRIQAFVVCPFIQQSGHETLASVASAEDMYTDIRKHFPKRTVALLHGKMDRETREDVFNRMRKGTIDMLVATPLIEVGIDIPNATVMVIEGAERFGLAQLHQLRGRVGRAGQKAYCFLFTSGDKETTTRLRILEQHGDGNTLAEMDVKIRGTGKILGTQQHGWSGLRFASWFDTSLIRECKAAIEEATASRGA